MATVAVIKRDAPSLFQARATKSRRIVRQRLRESGLNEAALTGGSGVIL
jgi:hypothetical protein